ncbi:hypothetical protein CYFUS_005771 [Cystobacter fuscus]|uniref:Uncharacterized protein n=1 Tax=Cystobacter fuscus TaxID=43 RepID=A0A250JA27_9BACT|nr:hypothetical protein CYFUS_005771 [Cystobacter fuscus]
METGIKERGMTFRVGVFGMTSRVMGLGLLVATVVHAQAVAPTPPPAPSTPLPVPRYVPAGAGAPRVGQPGDHAAPVARSPNARVLPPTGEPGIWAADEETKAVRRPSTTPQPEIDELLMATPSPGAPEAKSCRQRLLRASRTSGHEMTRHNLPPSPRACINARLLVHCVNRDFRTFEELAVRTPSPEGVDYIAVRRREVDASFFWQMRLCENFRSLPDIELVVSDILAVFERQSRSPK